MEGFSLAFGLVWPSWVVVPAQGVRAHSAGVAVISKHLHTKRARATVALRASVLNNEVGGQNNTSTTSTSSTSSNSSGGGGGGAELLTTPGSGEAKGGDSDQQKQDTQKIAAIVRGRILDMYVQYLSEDGSAVNYAALRTSREFKDYLVVAERLRDVQPHLLNRTERIAFFLNVYNALIIHGMAMQDSPPSNIIQRLLFYANNAYNIGGLEYSLNDIEHGVLRGNMPGPVPFSGKPFKADDPRLAASIESSPDARIHFALNCGAKSCPPVRCFNEDNLDYALEGAAQSFATDTENVRIDDKNPGVVYLSSIFKWYRVDFCPKDDTSDRALLRTIVSYIDPETRDPLAKRLREQLAALVESDKRVRCKFLPYNWSLNSA